MVATDNSERGTVNLIALGDAVKIRERARDIALGAGFSEAGVVALPHPGSVPAAERFEEFVAADFAGEMQWLERRNERGELVRAAVPRAFAWARSVVVCLASYNTGPVRSVDTAPPGTGWIARYALTGRARRADETGNHAREVLPSDYHRVLLRRLRSVESALKAEFGDFESRAYVDTGPLMERPLAAAAGLGWVGKNTCVIHPRLGSFVFLAVLVTSLDLGGEVGAAIAHPDRCGSCTRCLDACPTNALIAPRKMDARRCISYLTIEHEGEIDAELERGIGRNVFGCDICQDVCPWNRKPPIVRDPELAERIELVNPSLDWLAAMSEAEFEQAFNGSPVRRAGYAGLRANVHRAQKNNGGGVPK